MAIVTISDRKWELLDRILLVKPKKDPVNIDLTTDNSMGKTRKIFAALSKQQITTSEANELLCAVVAETKILMMTNFEKRLEILETYHRTG